MSILTNQVGINIAQNAIQLVEINQKENEIYLENVDEEFFEESIDLSTKETKFIHILQNAFNEIILRKPLLSSNVLISLPLNFFNFFEVPVDKNLSKNDLNDYLKWEFSKLFPTEIYSDYYLQTVYLETNNYLPYKRLMNYATSKDLLKRIFKFCVRNNLHLKVVDISHIAAHSVLLYNKNEFHYMSIIVEDKQLSLMLYNKNNFIYACVKSFNNISELPNFIQNIINEIENRGLLSSKIEKLFLFGSTISNELVNNLENLLKINTSIIHPFNELKINLSHLKPNVLSSNLTKYSPALGMALRLIS
jgi:Tfp pilus assembly PilM family ATPase